MSTEQCPGSTLMESKKEWQWTSSNKDCSGHYTRFCFPLQWLLAPPPPPVPGLSSPPPSAARAGHRSPAKDIQHCYYLAKVLYVVVHDYTSSVVELHFLWCVPVAYPGFYIGGCLIVCARNVCDHTHFN